MKISIVVTDAAVEAIQDLLEEKMEDTFTKKQVKEVITSTLDDTVILETLVEVVEEGLADAAYEHLDFL